MMFSMSDVTWIGEAMDRPECVACTQAGDVFVTKRDGLTRIGADGRTMHRVLGKAPDWMTNGFTIAHDGAFMLANLGSAGGAWRWSPDEGLRPFLQEVDGLRLPKAVNFVSVAPDRRVWISISTRLFPRDLGFKRGVEDGCARLLPLLQRPGLGRRHDAARVDQVGQVGHRRMSGG